MRPPAVTAEVAAATEKVILTPVSQTASESVILVEKRTLEPKSDEIIFQAANGPNYGLVVNNMRKGNRSPKGNSWSAIPVALLSKFVTVGDG